METITLGLEDLLAFHTVATEGSFTRAAARLGVSKGMLSKQVKRLEARLQAQLFHRTTRRLNLSEAGDLLLAYSRKICDLSDEASRRIQDQEQGATGRLKFSAPITLGELVFPGVLKALRTALPQVKIELDLSNDPRDFVASGLDFALRGSIPEEPELIARYLGHARDAICASPAFVKRTGIGADPRTLAAHPCILNSHDTAWNQWTFRRGAHEIAVDVTGPCATNQYPLARRLAQSGRGFVRLPLFVAERALRSGKLVRLFPDHDIATHPIHLVHARREFAPRKHRVAKEVLLQWFAHHPEYFSSNPEREPCR